ncbi:MAG: response regulator [Desulfobacteraceae bacterium]|nr:response regulator [Desulfobacteraceae bacterium]
MNFSKDNAIPGKKRITLSNALRNRLILTVSAIFIVTTLSNYWVSSHRAKVRNSNKTLEYLSYLSDNLEVPLWNMDEDWIESICKSFTNNDMIGLLKVYDGDAAVLFQAIKEKESDLATQKKELYLKGYHIGTIELGISDAITNQQNYRMLSINILTMTLVILGIAFSTKLILNKILEQPLNQLLTKIDDISKGEYDDTSKDSKHFEIFTILGKFNHMSQRVRKRETSLKEANKRLESEITDRKQVEKAHQESEERYQQLVENLSVGLFRSSPKPDGPFLMVNNALVNMLGYDSKQDFLKKKVASTYANPDMRSQVLELLFSQGEIQGFELEFVKNDGTTMVGLTTSRVICDEKDNPLYIDGIIEDITHRKNLENQIKQTQRMEALGTLAGGIAHDFNNILSSIFGFAEVAKLRYASGKNLTDPLDEILSAGIRARGLIKQIMTFSRQSEVKRNAITISPIVKETVKFLRASLPAMIEIRLDLKSTQSIILGEPTQIHQILMNLCTNSAHAMEHGGTLEIMLDDVEIDDDIQPEYQGMKPGEYLCLIIKDTGHGIKQEYMERIFEPFFTTKPRGEGTGMGLAMVHGIVTEMGGYIFVDSRTGKGSAFTIHIPVYEGEPMAFPASKVPLKTGKGNILFVDDENGFLESGTEILQGHGYKVIAALSGEEALSQFESSSVNIDLVVTDMVMPKMTGLELALQVKELKPDMPVILCTGFSSGIGFKAKEDAGISEMVMKPILAHELIGAIERSLKIKGA